MGTLEAHGHGLSPSVFTLDDRGRSYPKAPDIKIATEPIHGRITMSLLIVVWSKNSCGLVGSGWCRQHHRIASPGLCYRRPNAALRHSSMRDMTASGRWPITR